MAIESRIPGAAPRWVPGHDDASSSPPHAAGPHVTSTPAPASAPPHGLENHPRPNAAAAPPNAARRPPSPTATAVHAADALAKGQAAHRLTQIRDLARAKQHDAAVRLRQQHLHRLQHERALDRAERLDETSPLNVPDDGMPVGGEAPIWQGLRALGLLPPSTEPGGATPPPADPQARRAASEQVLRLIGGGTRQQRMSFEGVALQLLLDDIAVRDESGDAGPRGVTRDMIGRARAVAAARGLTPMAQRRLAALAPGAGVARRATVEAAFEGLLQSAAEGREISADVVLSTVHEAMTNAGLRATHGFSPEQTRAFINGLKARHPAATGVLAMGWMVEQALGQADRSFGQGDVLHAISVALASRVPVSARDKLSRPDPVAAGLRQVLVDIRLGIGEGQPLVPMLRLVLAALEDNADASEAELRAALPRLRDMLDDIAETAPSVEEAFVLRELLDRIGVQPASLEGALAPSELDMATYRGLGHQQRGLDAQLARERAVAGLWSAVERGNA